MQTSQTRKRTPMSEPIASRPVRKPVFSEKMMSRLMMLSERLKPVRDRCRRKMSANAIATSVTALVTLIARLRSKISVRRAYVFSFRL